MVVLRGVEDLADGETSGMIRRTRIEPQILNCNLRSGGMIPLRAILRKIRVIHRINRKHKHHKRREDLLRVVVVGILELRMGIRGECS